MFWLALCVVAVIGLAWYMRKTNAGSTGYDIYEDDTMPNIPYPGWNYWQHWHIHHHKHDSGSSFGSSDCSSDYSAEAAEAVVAEVGDAP